METASAFRSSLSGISSFPPHRVLGSWSTRPFSVRLGSSSLSSPGRIQQYTCTLRGNLSKGRMGFRSKKCYSIRASLHSFESEDSPAPVAPLQLESPVGQFLSGILVSHPHLVPAAVEQQLEQLQSDREAEENMEVQSSSGTDLVLYRRIAEVKANERRKALEEILYALVVQKFMEANVPLIPIISKRSSENSSPTRVDTWPNQDDRLMRMHSPEAYEMIQNHLALILGSQHDSNAVAQISKLRVGQIYAASIMYGYFLKRVDQRFQLEKKLKILPQGSDNKESTIQQDPSEEVRRSDNSFQTSYPHPEVSSVSAGGVSPGGFGYGIKPSRLRSYVMSLDGETIQGYATIRSKEAVKIIEKHTEALFGRPEIVINPDGTVDSSRDEVINISFGGLRRLVLEAVTFGSFLWDVESYVDSRYHFVAN